jgi:hypothetical protein
MSRLLKATPRCCVKRLPYRLTMVLAGTGLVSRGLRRRPGDCEQSHFYAFTRVTRKRILGWGWARAPHQ